METKKYEKLFEREQTKIETETKLRQDKKKAEADIIINFCNEELFNFLDYLQNTFYIRKHGVNHHVDGAVYTRDMVYNYSRKKSIEFIQSSGYFYTGVQHEWSNGGISDTVMVECVDFKPVFTYMGKKMTVEQFEETVVAQIQKSINRDLAEFQILNR